MWSSKCSLHPLLETVGLAICETGALPAPHHFSLLSFDKFGNLEPLPAGLGDLPLYLDHDGFFSVNGPLDLTVPSRTAVTLVDHDSHPAVRPLITNIPGFSREKPQIAPDYCQPINDDAISRSATSPPKTHALLNNFVVDHERTLREGPTFAASQVAPGDPHFLLNRRWTATTK